jgi:hypothetical protein
MVIARVMVANTNQVARETMSVSDIPFALFSDDPVAV